MTENPRPAKVAVLKEKRWLTMQAHKLVDILHGPDYVDARSDIINSIKFYVDVDAVPDNSSVCTHLGAYAGTPFPVSYFETYQEGRRTSSILLYDVQHTAKGRVLPLRFAVYHNGVLDARSLIVKYLLNLDTKQLAVDLSSSTYAAHVQEVMARNPHTPRAIVACVAPAISAVIMLQCNNVETIDNVPDDELVKKQIKNGKTPAFTYKTLHLKTREHQTPAQSGTHASPRLHIRRGHVRLLPSGQTTWVTACSVGKPSRGVVEKTYRIG